MKKLSFKMIFIILNMSILILAIPSLVKANTENLNAVVFENDETKIIYVENFETTDFKYAFSDTKVEDITNLTYITCENDSNEINVAYVMKEDTLPKFMYLIDSTSNYIVELENAEIITEEELEEIESLSTKISVNTGENEEYEYLSEEGIDITTTIAKILLLEEGEYQYQYIKIQNKDGTEDTSNSTATELYNLLSNINSGETMYEKLTNYIKIRDDYAKLLDEAEWTDVKDGKILQPSDVESGEKYILLLQKIENNKVQVQDIKFINYKGVDDEGVEPAVTEEETTDKEQTKSSLPITGESLIIYTSFIIIITAIIIVIIRIKSLKGKRNGRNL